MPIPARLQKAVGLVAALLALGSAAPALAQYYYPPPPPGYYPPRPPPYGPPPPPPYYAPPPPRYYAPPPTFLTLLIEPLMLAPLEQPQEFLELSAEIRARRWLGVDLLGGIGAWQDNTLGGTNGEAGLELNFYPVGGFRNGLQLAPFARFMFDGVGASVEWGGLLGYKWTGWAGFTWQIQAGFGVIDTLAFNGNSADVADGLVSNDIMLPWSPVLPGPGGAVPVGLLRFGVGWSL